MRLPNINSAFINLNKLQNYSLNPERDRGKYKSRHWPLRSPLKISNCS